MSEPFLAEVKIVGFNFAPRGWAFCDGQIMPIAQNQALFALLGTTYGGDGRTSFALPDLRGRTPIQFDAEHQLGQKAGEETHTLSVAEMPQHTHGAQAADADADTADPANHVLGRALNLYQGPSALVELRSGTVTNTGSGQPHNNMQPTLVLNFCIALKGRFPSRN